MGGRLGVLVGDRGSRQDEGERGAGEERCGHVRGAVGEGSEERVRSQVVEEDRADHRDTDRAAELLDGAEQARGSTGGPAGNGGKHDVGKRDDQQGQPDTRHDEAGDDRPGVGARADLLGAEVDADDPQREQQRAAGEDEPAVALRERDRERRGDDLADDLACAGWLSVAWTCAELRYRNQPTPTFRLPVSSSSDELRRCEEPDPTNHR
jgi:hypothetical protein